MSKNLDFIPMYVMECIRPSRSDDKDLRKKFSRDRDAFERFWKDYERVECYSYNLKRTPNEVDRIAHYIAGCQPTFNIEIYTNQHKELLKKWGWTEHEAEKDCYDFYEIVANCISEMHKFFYCDDE